MEKDGLNLCEGSYFTPKKLRGPYCRWLLFHRFSAFFSVFQRLLEHYPESACILQSEVESRACAMWCIEVTDSGLS
ncbi:MAG: hypothetical protein OFPII_24490 [Osedax symbiont Rs1]|nr:MAG: hypothetical protein OFPII_24490 [Osedax symbiont Rs1]